MATRAVLLRLHLGVLPGRHTVAGVLTPEQFKKLVWTEAGYADQLVVGDKAKEVEIPADALPGRL